MRPPSRSVRVEYSAYIHIKHRCYNTNHKQYKDYGGRGIGLHEPWMNDFWGFYDYVGPRPGPEYSIDRIDNDRNYEPGNLRWATRRMQQNNQRRNVRVTCPRTGITQTVSEWGRALNMCTRTLSHRLRRGWPIEAVLYTPRLRPCERLGFNGKRYEVTINGQTVALADAARARGIKMATLYGRLRKGLSPLECLKPVKSR